jgi:hypothetical protein
MGRWLRQLWSFVIREYLPTPLLSLSSAPWALPSPALLLFVRILLVPLVLTGEATSGSFFVFAFHVRFRLTHGGDHLVERDEMLPITTQSKE